MFTIISSPITLSGLTIKMMLSVKTQEQQGVQRLTMAPTSESLVSQPQSQSDSTVRLPMKDKMCVWLSHWLVWCNACAMCACTCLHLYIRMDACTHRKPADPGHNEKCMFRQCRIRCVCVSAGLHAASYHQWALPVGTDLSLVPSPIAVSFAFWPFATGT